MIIDSFGIRNDDGLFQSKTSFVHRLLRMRINAVKRESREEAKKLKQKGATFKEREKTWKRISRLHLSRLFNDVSRLRRKGYHKESSVLEGALMDICSREGL